MRKIVVLDGYLVNPGDLSWDKLRELGNCEIHDRTPPNCVIERCKNAEIVITNKVEISAREMNQLPSLKYIGVSATGYNNVDIKSARENLIMVTNVPAYSTYSTAQHTFALLLEATNQVGQHNQAVHEGEWIKSMDFSFCRSPLLELNKLNFGIVGYGVIGQKVAEIAHAFGMNVLVHTRSVAKTMNFEVNVVDKTTLFKESDVISLHCPLTPETQHIINKTTLDLMKPSAILLNAARGGLVDEQALANALTNRTISAAAVDVLNEEPPSADCPLLNLANCIITPHNAWASLAARKRLLASVIANIQGYMGGAPINIVS